MAPGEVVWVQWVLVRGRNFTLSSGKFGVAWRVAEKRSPGPLCAERRDKAQRMREQIERVEALTHALEQNAVARQSAVVIEQQVLEAKNTVSGNVEVEHVASSFHAAEPVLFGADRIRQRGPRTQVGYRTIVTAQFA